MKMLPVFVEGVHRFLTYSIEDFLHLKTCLMIESRPSKLNGFLTCVILPFSSPV
jgi:hypothetical protein